MLHKKAITIFFFLSLLSFASCSIFTYSPRSKKQKQRQKPSVILLNNIIDFREAYNEWPVTIEHFSMHGKKYKDALHGFKYQNTRFKIIDQDNMIFYFSDHVKDAANFESTERIDLNSYGGRVKFYKRDGKFLWKIKMNKFFIF